jgi:hypothetical protein
MSTLYSINKGGRWTGRTYCGDAVEINTPPGCEAVEGDPRDLMDAGVMLPPEPPPVTAEISLWQWDAVGLRYVSTPSQQQVEQSLRLERSSRIAACSWRLEKWAWQGVPVPPEWAAYVQALRDITDQPGWPLEVVWPKPPTEAPK